MRLVVALIVALLPSLVFADAYVLKIGDSCSSVWVRTEGEHCFGLTASHCCVAVGQEVTIRGERDFNALVIHIDPNRDIAILKAFSSNFSEPPSMTLAAPKEGECVIRGFPGGAFRSVRANVVGLIDAELAGGAEPRVLAKAPPGSFGGGLSGGGVFQDGCLVGIHTHGCKSGCHGFFLSVIDEADVQTTCVGSRCKSFVDRVIDSKVEGIERKVVSDVERAFSDLLRPFNLLYTAIVGWLSILLKGKLDAKNQGGQEQAQNRNARRKRSRSRSAA